MKLLLRVPSTLASTLVLALVLAGCSSSDESTDATSAEETAQRQRLQEKWVGAWEGQFMPASGASPSFTLDLAYRAPEATPQCGTVELGAGIDVACVTDYRLGVRGVLTSNDGRFQATAVEGLVEYGALRLDLPDGGFLRVDESGTAGTYRFGTSEAEGTLTAHKK